MPTPLPTIEESRAEAIGLLQDAFGMPDGQMAFTYKGSTYQTLHTNADKTLRVIDTTTGLVTESLDPIKIYDAALLASGQSPLLLDDGSKAKGPSTFTTVMDMAGTYIGMANLAIMGLTKLVTQTVYKTGLGGYTLAGKVTPALFQVMEKALGAAGVVLGGYSLFRGIEGVFKDGLSANAMVSIGGSFFSVATGLNMLMHSSMFGPTGWLIAAGYLGGLIGYNLIKGWLEDSHPRAFRDLTRTIMPIVWSAAPLLFIGAGVSALLMGWPKDEPEPTMSAITVPQAFVTRTLGRELPANTSKAPTLLVEHGTDGKPGRVVIVTPQGDDEVTGQPQVRLEAYTLWRDLEFVSSPKPPLYSYIPFFVYDKNGEAIPNPAVVKVLSLQESFLRSVMSGALDTPEALSAILKATIINKVT